MWIFSLDNIVLNNYEFKVLLNSAKKFGSDSTFSLWVARIRRNDWVTDEDLSLKEEIDNFLDDKIYNWRRK